MPQITWKRANPISYRTNENSHQELPKPVHRWAESKPPPSGAKRTREQGQVCATTSQQAGPAPASTPGAGRTHSTGTHRSSAPSHNTAQNGCPNGPLPMEQVRLPWPCRDQSRDGRAAEQMAVTCGQTSKTSQWQNRTIAQSRDTQAQQGLLKEVTRGSETTRQGRKPCPCSGRRAGHGARGGALESVPPTLGHSRFTPRAHALLLPRSLTLASAQRPQGRESGNAATRSAPNPLHTGKQGGEGAGARSARGSDSSEDRAGARPPETSKKPRPQQLRGPGHCLPATRLPPGAPTLCSGRPLTHHAPLAAPGHRRGTAAPKSAPMAGPSLPVLTQCSTHDPDPGPASPRVWSHRQQWPEGRNQHKTAEPRPPPALPPRPRCPYPGADRLDRRAPQRGCGSPGRHCQPWAHRTSSQMVGLPPSCRAGGNKMAGGVSAGIRGAL